MRAPRRLAIVSYQGIIFKEDFKHAGHVTFNFECDVNTGHGGCEARFVCISDEFNELLDQAAQKCGIHIYSHSRNPNAGHKDIEIRGMWWPLEGTHPEKRLREIFRTFFSHFGVEKMTLPDDLRFRIFRSYELRVPGPEPGKPHWVSEAILEAPTFFI
jgi:hypothetical protein